MGTTGWLPTGRYYDADEGRWLVSSEASLAHDDGMPLGYQDPQPLDDQSDDSTEDYRAGGGERAAGHSHFSLDSAGVGEFHAVSTMGSGELPELNDSTSGWPPPRDEEGWGGEAKHDEDGGRPRTAPHAVAHPQPRMSKSTLHQSMQLKSALANMWVNSGSHVEASANSALETGSFDPASDHALVDARRLINAATAAADSAAGSGGEDDAALEEPSLQNQVQQLEREKNILRLEMGEFSLHALDMCTFGTAHAVQAPSNT